MQKNKLHLRLLKLKKRSNNRSNRLRLVLQEKSFQKRLMKKRINISLMKQSTKDSSMKVKHAVSALYQLALENDAIHDVLTSFETIHEQLTENVISYLDAPTVDIQQKFDAV